MITSNTLNKEIEGHIRNLSDTSNEPFYLYNRNEIRKICWKFLNLPYSPKSIHFAMMANSNPRFLRIIKEEGLSIFVNSLMHMKTAQELSFMGEDIIFTSSAIDEQTMKKVKSSGAIFNLDSISQIKTWFILFPETPVGIRCNIGKLVVPRKTLAGYFLGDKSRLGLSLEEIELLKGNPFIRGLHLYAGTNIVDFTYFVECYNQITKLAELFPSLEYLDFGGGFGLGKKSPEEFDMESYGNAASELMNRVSKRLGRPIKLILEPGRIIGGNAGYFVCRVIDIKIRGTHQFIGVNASSVQFPRPLFYPDSAFHPISIIYKNPSFGEKIEMISSITGCSTYSRDFLARDVLLPQISVGDIVVLGYAGSYCSSAHTKFLGFPEAEEYFI